MFVNRTKRGKGETEKEEAIRAEIIDSIQEFRKSDFFIG